MAASERSAEHPRDPAARPVIADRFRYVLGHLPTGVTVITAADGAGPVGMVVGTFTSVSLTPPLVAFLPAATSTSFPRIRGTGSFCANVLAADQEWVSRGFAGRRGGGFGALEWRPAPSGSPILDGAVAWVDCDIRTVHEAGDHFVVIGAVRALDVATGAAPLLFHRGGYGLPARDVAEPA